MAGAMLSGMQSGQVPAALWRRVGQQGMTEISSMDAGSYSGHADMCGHGSFFVRCVLLKLRV